MAFKPQGKTMYVVSELDRAWLLSEQTKLYAKSWNGPEHVFRKLWGLVTDLRNLRCAFSRVATNRGRRTAGVDGVTVRRIVAEGVEDFLTGLREEMRRAFYQPSPSRRVLIPKVGKPGQFRPLGIPTVKDRVVQAAVKNIMEPIFEADFFPCSYGFRPSRSAHGALEKLRLHLRSPRLVTHGEDGAPYQVAIEADIKGCFDNISHHGLMNRVRRRIGDRKLSRLVVAFLRAGILSESQFSPTKAGTPQGGILSPLLANIALSVVDERYARHVWARHTPTSLYHPGKINMRTTNNRGSDWRRGRPVYVTVRYADDFVILVSAPKGPDRWTRALELAHKEKAELARLLKESLNLELSATKTLVTRVTSPIQFLGHCVRVQEHRLYGWLSNTVIPKAQTLKLRETIKAMFRKPSCGQPLARLLERLNLVLRGWGNFFRHARGAKQIFNELDRYVWWTIRRWLRKKHDGTGMRQLYRRYGKRRPGRRSIHWHDGDVEAFRMQTIPVERFRLTSVRPPDFIVNAYGEPGA